MDDEKNERPLFQGIDEFERTYAPGELPPDDPERQKAQLDEGGSFRDATDIEEPSAAPVANLGSSPSGAMAAPNIGHRDHGGAPGDPETEAEYPMDDDDTEA